MDPKKEKSQEGGEDMAVIKRVCKIGYQGFLFLGGLLFFNAVVHGQAKPLQVGGLPVT